MDAGDDGGARLVLLRYSGDVSTKSGGTRFQFARRLGHNLRDALESAGVPGRVRLSHDRIHVELAPGSADLSVLTRVFGLQSLSAVERRCGTSLVEVVAAGEALFRDRVRDRHFAVRARRVGDRSRIPLSARDVERELGAALLPHASGVELGAPEVTLRVELTEQETFLFGESLAAPGGLPIGVEGRAVALLSGGFDSAAAAWLMAKRGVALDYVFCNLGGATHEHGTLRVAKVLGDRWSYGDRPRFHAVDFAPVVTELMRAARPRYWQVLLKRMMLRAAEAVARERRALAIVTGEAVGQVSSQTLANLAAISPATSLPILRPLAGFNKEEIIDLTRHIGTYDLSKVVGEYCAIVPRRPATAATLLELEAEEAGLDPSVVSDAVAKRAVRDLRELDLEKIELPDLETRSVPEDAVLLDLRSKAGFDSWHAPGALRMDFAQALAAYASFDRTRRYVLTCELGLKSLHLAELMRREGFEARHFRGGIPALRRASERGGSTDRR